MRRVVLAVAVGLLAGSAVAQDAVDNGAVLRDIQQLEVGLPPLLGTVPSLILRHSRRPPG
jgi:hypothetical protein